MQEGGTEANGCGKGVIKGGLKTGEESEEDELGRHKRKRGRTDEEEKVGGSQVTR